jgi:hypothetical protein
LKNALQNTIDMCCFELSQIYFHFSDHLYGPSTATCLSLNHLALGMPEFSALGPIDPTSVNAHEEEEKSAPWIVRKLVGVGDLSRKNGLLIRTDMERSVVHDRPDCLVIL